MMFLKLGWKRAGRFISSFVQALPVWTAEAEGFQGYSLCSFALVLLISHLKWSATSHVYEDIASAPASSGCISLPGPVVAELLCDIVKFILCL